METPMRDDDPGKQWLDEAAGPIVRAYVLTGGRTTTDHGTYELTTLIVATVPVEAIEPKNNLTPEQMTIMQVCQEPQSVVEIAQRLGKGRYHPSESSESHADIDGYLGYPVSTVRVLLGDLAKGGFIEAHDPPTTDQYDQALYQAVIDGLRAL
jgi:hypothetical protein